MSKFKQQVTQIIMVANKKTKREKSKVYGNNITYWLDETGMTQAELAKAIDTNEGHISRIISGKRKHISLAIAVKIAQVFKQPVEVVFITTKDKIDVSKEAKA